MDEVTLPLRDGTTGLARRLRPEDAHRLSEGLSELSERSRFQRFHAGVSKLSRSHLDYLSDVDQVHHLAWGVIDPQHPATSGLGVVRAVQLAQAPDTVEFAVTVVDHHQRQGLGTLLLGLIALDAAQRGYRWLSGRVALSNTPMLALLDHLGATSRPVEDDPGNVDRVLSLDLGTWPDSPQLRRIRAVLTDWPSAPP